MMGLGHRYLLPEDGDEEHAIVWFRILPSQPRDWSRLWATSFRLLQRLLGEASPHQLLPEAQILKLFWLIF
jgi:hypothetical protein